MKGFNIDNGKGKKFEKENLGLSPSSAVSQLFSLEIIPETQLPHL